MARFESRPLLKTIGIFGGTFDPIHIGHLRMALELKQHLGLDEMRLLPCHQPPHRAVPGVTSDHRAAMTRLAVAHCPELTVDERELRRDEPSYTVETLTQMREELGQEVSLCLAMGMDSLMTFPRWVRSQEILSLANLVVAARPGWSLPEQGEAAQLLARYQVEAGTLKTRPSGGIVVDTLRLLPISATEIREQIATGISPQYLLPDSVWTYICEQGLYR